MDQLDKLKDLLDQGAITQEEYDIKKRQILGL
nr:SHOCT domain-containing protein [Companilactobacillus zhachilii]